MKADIEPTVRAVVSAVLSAKTDLTLEKARTLAEAVQRRANEMGVKPVIAVCDAGGNPLLMHREEGAFIASVDIAVNKAYTSVALKMPTKDLAALAAPGGSLYGIQFTNGGRIVIFGGGVPLTVGDSIVGGFGVSGGTAAEDTALGDFAERYFSEELL